MTFSIEHDFDDLFQKMNKEKVYNENTFVSILKKTVKPLVEELRNKGADSLRTFAQASSGDYNRAAEASRAKYGELQKALGVYKSRTVSSLGEHGVTVGYLPSKQDKAFIAHFLNYGWKNAKSGRKITTPHEGWMQRAEENTMTEMKAIFDLEVTKVFEVEMAKKFASTKRRKVK